MNPISPKTDLLDTQANNLPVKITVIVFWGMIIVGLLAAFFLLRGLERDTAYRYSRTADHVAYELNLVLQNQQAAATAQIGELMRRLLAQRDIRGVTLNLAGDTLAFGDTAASLTAIQREARYPANGKTGPGKVAQISIFLPPIEETVQAQRNRILVSMGMVLLAFGLILQWILRKVLTQPFQDMMFTARRITDGKIALRFDQARADEFGFLATFINQALDSVTRQQTELREALARTRDSESALFAEKERAQVTLHSINDAVITTDASGRIDFLNPVAESLTGVSQMAARGKPIQEVIQLVDESSLAPLENPLVPCLRDARTVEPTDQVVLVRNDDRRVDITYSAAPMRNSHGVISGAVMVLHDLGHSRVMARELSYQASHDELTGLYNRREFERQLRIAADSAQIGERGHVLCYLDMDQFKVVNDTCGHVAGDELLRQFTALLQKQVRDSDIIARLGGDEFGILLKHCSMENASRTVTALLGKVRELRFHWQDRRFDVGVSIGLVAITENNKDVSEILSAADVACYAAKDAGRNRVHVYSLDDDVLRRHHGEMQWVSRLGKALEEDRFLLYCQPIASVRSERHCVNHYEILLRLQDEGGKIIPPGAFIPAAERYNLMPQIDRWVIRETLALLAHRMSGANPIVVAINVSGQSLGESSFLGFVIDAIDNSGVSPKQVCFEITETAAIANLQRAIQFISILRGMGCVFALDDFGSGLSSFNYLKNLQVDYLKLDGNFVKEMLNNPIDHALVEATNQIGHAMGIKTIAESVENQDVLDALRKIGVDYAQGYGIARPCPVEELFPDATRKAQPTRSLRSSH
jgi:diguanylate cyclase (GGDEF)-like protein/PAS domain S-box-containing protein